MVPAAAQLSAEDTRARQASGLSALVHEPSHSNQAELGRIRHPTEPGARANPVARAVVTAPAFWPLSAGGLGADSRDKREGSGGQLPVPWVAPNDMP